MKIAITGSSGLVGSALVQQLRDSAHQVLRIVRSTPREDEVQWDPELGKLDPAGLEGIDAVVHLAGENIAAARWSKRVKQRILDSRRIGTRTLCEALARLPQPPAVLVSASAIGFYGDRGDELLDEQSPPGTGFLAEVAQAWEAATEPAAEAGVRVVLLRFGVILSRRGGALRQMLLPFRLGFGGRVGSGRQYWSWISLADAVGAIAHCLDKEALTGPVNAVAPNPVTNRQFTRALGRVLRRPTVLPMPALAARLVLGELANELLLASTRVAPRKLLATEFPFQHLELEAALRAALSDPGC